MNMEAIWMSSKLSSRETVAIELIRQEYDRKLRTPENKPAALSTKKEITR